MKLLDFDRQERIFKIEDSGGFIATTRDYMSGNVDGLRESLIITYTITALSKEVVPLKKASEKYGIPFPDVRYTVIFNGFRATIFYELEGYGIKAPPLIILVPNDRNFNITDKDDVTNYVLTLLICDQCSMEWENTIQDYLVKNGINFENVN